MRHRNKIILKDFRGFVSYLQSIGADFTVTSTGYTKTIKHDGQTFNFVETVISENIFSCTNKIKSDIQKSGVVIDAVPMFDVRYYSIGKYLQRKNVELPDTLYNVDIKSAYLTTLKRYAMITSETFDFVQSRGKATRLKAVGMLATNKMIFTYEAGRLKTFHTERNNQMANYFFFCCYTVGQLMSQLAAQLGDAFLFFWVDGIYISDKSKVEGVMKFLSDEGYQTKAETLEECHLETVGKHLQFSYKNGDIRKVFSIPVEDEVNKINLKNYLTSLQHESQHSNFSNPNSRTRSN